MIILARTFLALSVCFAAVLLGSAQEGFADGTEIRLMQWHHFVPRHDEWFDGYAERWGQANNVDVLIDRIALPDIASTLAAELDAGQGHTIIEMPVSPAAFLASLQDLRALNEQASEMFGDQRAACRATTYLPRADIYYGFVNMLIPVVGSYDIALWSAVGYPEGPRTYAELLAGGREIYETTGIPIGIGLSPEPDSEMALRSILWSFGGSVQDEDENVTLNSEATIAAVEYVAKLQAETMTDEVFGWGIQSNNQALIAGEASFILNPTSAYRSLQKVDASAAEGIGFSTALAGPAGALLATNVLTMVIPNYVEGTQLEAATQFILDHTASSSQVAYHSELYNVPCFPAAAPELAGWLADDPFGSQPVDKLSALSTVAESSANLGYPGLSNPAVGQVFAEHIIPNMMAKVALEQLTAEEAVAQASARVEEIFAIWRERGLVGGGD